MFLASSGIGRITVCDGDRVELTNLQRQIVHRMDAIGEPKARSAAATLATLNPDIRVEALDERAGPERLAALVRAADVVLDCSDNFATRHALNRACDDQLRDIGRKTAPGRCSGEENDAERKHTAASEAIARSTADEQERCEEQRERLDDPLRIRDRRSKAALQRRERDVDDGAVDERHARRENRGGEDPGRRGRRTRGGSLHAACDRFIAGESAESSHECSGR